MENAHDVARKTTPLKRTDLRLQARIVSGPELAWGGLSSATVRSSPLLRTLSNELADMNVTRAYMTKNDGNVRVASEGMFTREVILESGPLFLRSPKESADAVWLGKSQAYVDLTRDRILFLARGRKGLHLAGRYSAKAPEMIVRAFGEKNIDEEDIEIFSFFSPESKDLTAADRLVQECAKVNLNRVTHLCRLEENDPFPYSNHVPHSSSLGIITW